MRCLALALLSVFLINASGYQSSADKTRPEGMKTKSGFEVFLDEANATKDRDPLNNVPVYRHGSCPPGAVLPDVKLIGDNGHEVVIVRLGIKVLPDYAGGSVSLPVLIGAGGKKYHSRATMLSDSLPEMLRTLKGTGKQLQCEFPFEIPAGTQIKQVQFEEVLFDLKQ